jgi:hypothetical protein
VQLWRPAQRSVVASGRPTRRRGRGPSSRISWWRRTADAAAIQMPGEGSAAVAEGDRIMVVDRMPAAAIMRCRHGCLCERRARRHDCTGLRLQLERCQEKAGRVSRTSNIVSPPSGVSFTSGEGHEVPMDPSAQNNSFSHGSEARRALCQSRGAPGWPRATHPYQAGNDRPRAFARVLWTSRRSRHGALRDRRPDGLRWSASATSLGEMCPPTTRGRRLDNR